MEKNKRGIRILQILHSFGTGGAETWLLDVARYIKQHPELEVQMDFLLTGEEKGNLEDQLIQTGTRIFRIRYSLGSLRSFRKGFIKLLRSEKYDALHNHLDFISGWHFLAGLGALPRNRIAHLHNPYNLVRGYVSSPGRWLSFRGGRFFMALLATQITGTSDAVMDEYGYNRWMFKRKRVSPLYCGIDIDKFRYDSTARKKICEELDWTPESNICLFVGRIGLEAEPGVINQKNPEFAYQLARALVTRHDNWKFIFAGHKGKTGEGFEKELTADGLADRIRFLGIRRDVPVLMSAADIFIFPSLWEGLGMVAVEAQATGLRVIASDTIPAEAEVTRGLVHFYKLSDGPERWASEIDRTQQTQPAMERIVFNPIVASSPFSIQNSVNKMIKAYEN